MVSLVRDLSALQFNWHLQWFSLVLLSCASVDCSIDSTRVSSDLFMFMDHSRELSSLAHSSPLPRNLCILQSLLRHLLDTIFSAYLFLSNLASHPSSSFILLELPSQISAIRKHTHTHKGKSPRILWFTGYLFCNSSGQENGFILSFWGL